MHWYSPASRARAWCACVSKSVKVLACARVSRSSPSVVPAVAGVRGPRYAAAKNPRYRLNHPPEMSALRVAAPSRQRHSQVFVTEERTGGRREIVGELFRIGLARWGQ